MTRRLFAALLFAITVIPLACLAQVPSKPGLNSMGPTSSDQLRSIMTDSNGTGPLTFGGLNAVSSVESLKATTVRPSAIWLSGRVSAGDCGHGVFDWVAGSSATADDGMVVQPTTGAAGRFIRRAAPQFVSLCFFVGATNPLQAALDYLGAAGGTIAVPAQEWTIATTVTSTANLRNLRLVGEGPGSALVFSGTGGGLALTLATPSSTEAQKDQIVVENLAILTNHYASTSGLNGSGSAISATWATAVGDGTQGSTLRNVQIGPKDKNATGGEYAWWDTAVSLQNARNTILDGVQVWGASGQTLGVGVDLKGGSVDTSIYGNSGFIGLDKGVYVRGTSEGIFVNSARFINVNYTLYADGDELGGPRTTSTTSNTVGTGSKSFTVAHTGLNWNAGDSIVIRDAAAPRTNYMTGNVTSYSGTSLVVNVASSSGAGTLTSWSISVEHKISGIVLQSAHGSAVKRQVRARWTAFGFVANSQFQKREGTSDDYLDVEFLDENVAWNINNALFNGTGSGGTQAGIFVHGDNGGTDARNFYFNFNNLQFSGRDYGIKVENNVQHVESRGVRALGNVASLIVNQATLANGGATVRFADWWNDDTVTSAPAVFDVNDATPSIASGSPYYRTANNSSTTITAFDDGYVGQVFSVLVNDANTSFAHSAGLLLKNSKNYTATNADIVTFVRESSTVVREISRNAAASIGASFRTGFTSSDLLWKQGGTTWNARLGDDSADADLHVGNLVAGGSLSAASGGAIQWSGNSGLLSPTNGTVRFANAARTAGVTVDVTTDGTLKLRDRLNSADGNLTAAAGTFSGQIISSFGTPTISSAACGTGSNGSISGTNQAGLITIGAAATTTCTVSFSTTITAPKACLVFPANATAAATGTTVARVSSISTTNFVVTGSALASSNYYYICL